MIRASAGTGKTFQLSNRFIGLAARQAPDDILATTFTRKAAGEILDRVLVRLAEAALEPKKLAELARHVDGPAIDRARCLGMLREMIRHLHRLRVSTLDSFFVQIAQSFSLELGLPPGWAIAEEIADQALRAEAIRTVLQSEVDPGRRAPDAPADQGRGRALGERADRLAGRRPCTAIYIEAPAEAWKSLPRHKQLGAAELLAAIEALEEVPLPAGKRFQKAHDQDLANAPERRLGSLPWARGWAPRSSTARRRSTGNPSRRRSSRRTGRWSSTPRPCCWPASPTRPRPRATCWSGSTPPTSGSKASERSLRFEDVTRRLGEAAIADRLDEVVYRLDGQVAHLLLDEFQDTSALQWRVLRPFAQRVIRGGADRSFFCVGDVKQAIYGWRGGVAEIFEALDDEFGGLPSQALNQSFRSSPVVIDCVNKVFEGIADNPVLQKCPAAAQKWSAAVHAAHDRPQGTARLLPHGHRPAGRRRRGARGGHAAVRGRGSCPAPRAGAGAGHRRAGPPQRGRGPADLRVATAGHRRQRGGRQPA